MGAGGRGWGCATGRCTATGGGADEGGGGGGGGGVGSGVAADGAAGAVALAGATGCPQEVQKRAAAFSWVPQWMQNMVFSWG